MTIFFICFFLFFRENKSWHFMWIVCLADDSHEISRLVFSEKKFFECRLLHILLGALRVNLAENLCSVSSSLMVQYIIESEKSSHYVSGMWALDQAIRLHWWTVKWENHVPCFQRMFVFHLHSSSISFFFLFQTTSPTELTKKETVMFCTYRV